MGIATPEKTPVSLSSLSYKKQLAFGLLVFERMLPALEEFSDATGFDKTCYLQARKLAWDVLGGCANAPTESLALRCAKAAPDTEEYTHEVTSYALNAALAISEILEFIVDNRAEHIEYVSSLAMDSVDLFLNSSGPPVLPRSDNMIAGHPLMRRELQQQKDDIEFLSKLDNLGIETIPMLRSRANEQPSLLRMKS